jgi:hypothetical protein
MSTEIQPPAVPHIPLQRALTNLRPPAAAYRDGQTDAFDESRPVIAARIAAAYDYATTHVATDPQRAGAAMAWADQYAAGALHTWQALAALDAALANLGGGR